jgi:hypothetical protein
VAEQEQPFTGKWCWIEKHLLHPWNSYAYFRRTVDLKDVPREALVRVSADARYTLYVNGQRLHQGPARFLVAHPSYDVLDLAPLLRRGVNTLCAIVHQFGIPTFFHQYRDQAGFFLDGEIGGTSVSTPEGWLCRYAKAWKKETGRRSPQQGFQELFDADADPAGWMSPEFVADEKGGWRGVGWVLPANSHPWLRFEPRGVPLLTDHLEEFAAVLGTWYGKSGRGYKITSDICGFAKAETRKKDASDSITDPAALLHADSKVTTIAPPGDGDFVAIVLDLKTYRTGHIVLDIEGAAGDEIIDFIYAEQLDDKGFIKLYGAYGLHSGASDRYRCRAGDQTWETFQYTGVQYLAVIFRNIKQPLKVRHIGIRQVHANIPELGSFKCGDEMLNKIWEVAKNTQINCTFDSFVDCPWREQAQWWGDARVQAKVTMYAFGDTSIFERGIRQVRLSQAGDGSTHSHPPADMEHRLPDFSLTWVETVSDFYEFTGRTDHLSECMPAVHRVMEFFRAHEIHESLVDRFDGFWNFLDWADLYKGNVSSVLNLYYLKTLRTAVKLCKLMKDPKAAEYEQRAAALAKSIEKFFWDPKTKQWHEGYDVETKEPKTKLSQHATALAILCGLQPSSHADLAREVLIKTSLGKRSDVTMASSFFHNYVFEALNQLGMQKYAITIIRKLWGEMIDKGATAFWEGFSGNESRCHAWSSSPLYVLSEQLLGIQRTAPGWKEVRIAPVPCGLEYARGEVPTPFGLIKVDWENVGDDQLAVKVELPEGIEGEFISPTGGTRALFAGSQEFSA